MSNILMLIIAGISVSTGIWYFISAWCSKKREKDKKTISEELVELLKE